MFGGRWSPWRSERVRPPGLRRDGSPALAPVDVLLWGANGFTGQLVAQYFARAYGFGGNLRWAIGGRNRGKLEKVRAALETVDPRARELPIVVGADRDRASASAAASRRAGSAAASAVGGRAAARGLASR